MTLNKFIKTLQKLEKQYGGRLPVCANTAALRQTCTDTWAVIDIRAISVDDVEQVDGDGFTKWRKDGFSSTRKCLVLE